MSKTDEGSTNSKSGSAPDDVEIALPEMMIDPCDGSDMRPATLAEELGALLFWLRAVKAQMAASNDQFTDALALAARGVLADCEGARRASPGYTKRDFVAAYAHIDSAIAGLNAIDERDMEPVTFVEFADAFADAREMVRGAKGGAERFGAVVALMIWTGDHPAAGWSDAELHDGVAHTLAVVTAASLETFGVALLAPVTA